MLNRMTINQLPEVERLSVEVALMTLAQTGVLIAQISADKSQLLDQRMDKDSDLSKLSQDIVELRIQNNVLRGLHDLGTQYSKEKGT